MKCQKSSYLFFCSICPQVFCIYELWSLVNFPWSGMHIVGVPSNYDTLSGKKWWVSLMPSHAVTLGFRVLEMWFGVAVFCWCVVRVETNAVQFFDFVNDLRFQSFKILAIREPWIAIFQKKFRVTKPTLILDLEKNSKNWRFSQRNPAKNLQFRVKMSSIIFGSHWLRVRNRILDFWEPLVKGVQLILAGSFFGKQISAQYWLKLETSAALALDHSSILSTLP